MSVGVSCNTTVQTVVSRLGEVIPSPRTRATCVPLDGHIVLAGGSASVNPTTGRRFLSDTYLFDLSTRRWQPIEGSGFPPVIHAAASRCGQSEVIVHGGMDDEGVIHSSAFVFDRERRWKRIPFRPRSEPSPCRMEHASVADPMSGLVYFHGGITTSRAPEDCGAQTDLDNFVMAGSDVHVLCLRTQSWSTLSCSTLSTRASLRRHVMGYRNGCLYLLGGYKGISNDEKSPLSYRVDVESGAWTPLQLDYVPVSPVTDVASVMMGVYRRLHEDGSWSVVQLKEFDSGTSILLSHMPCEDGVVPPLRGHPAVATTNAGIWLFGGEEEASLLLERLDARGGLASTMLSEWERLVTEWGVECRAVYNDCYVWDGSWAEETGLASRHAMKLRQATPTGTTPLPDAERVHRSDTQARRVNTSHAPKRLPMWMRPTRPDVTKPPPPPDWNIYFGMKASSKKVNREPKGFLDKPLHRLAQEEYVLQRRRHVLTRHVPGDTLERYETMLDECFDIAANDHMQSDHMVKRQPASSREGKKTVDREADDDHDAAQQHIGSPSMSPVNPPKREPCRRVTRDTPMLPDYATRADRILHFGDKDVHPAPAGTSSYDDVTLPHTDEHALADMIACCDDF